MDDSGKRPPPAASASTPGDVPAVTTNHSTGKVLARVPVPVELVVYGGTGHLALTMQVAEAETITGHELTWVHDVGWTHLKCWIDGPDGKRQVAVELPVRDLLRAMADVGLATAAGEPPTAPVSERTASVLGFHTAAGAYVAVPDTPTVRKARLKLLREELTELMEALATGSLADVLKELADLDYVVTGTAVALGLDLDEAFRRVHASNMSKLAGGFRLTDPAGKVPKGDDYQPPDLTGCYPEVTGDA